MKEPMLLNRKPLNRLTREKLQQLKMAPNPTQLYIQQLLTWALGNGTLQTIPEIEDRIGQMLQWKPEVWMSEVTNLNQEEGVPVELSDKNLSPKDLAWKILDQIESQYREQTS